MNRQSGFTFVSLQQCRTHKPSAGSSCHTFQAPYNALLLGERAPVELVPYINTVTQETTVSGHSRLSYTTALTPFYSPRIPCITSAVFVGVLPLLASSNTRYDSVLLLRRASAKLQSDNNETNHTAVSMDRPTSSQ